MATIIRVEKTKNYSVISNHHLDNPDLSLKAKGLLTYLLSRPDDWKVNVNHLVKTTTDGKASIYSTLKELRKHGYIIYNQVRDNEKIIGGEYIVYERPLTNNDTSYVNTDFLNLDNLNLDNPTILNTDTNQILTTTTKPVENVKQDSDTAVSSSSIFLDSIKSILPQDKQTSDILNMLENKLNKGHTEQSIYDAIAYSLTHAKTDFYGYLGKCIDQQYAPLNYSQNQHQDKESKEQEIYNRRKQLPDDLLKQFAAEGDKIAERVLKERDC